MGCDERLKTSAISSTSTNGSGVSPGTALAGAADDPSAGRSGATACVISTI